MYEAIVCKIKNIRCHPNAERLNLATVQGYQIIVGKDIIEDTLGVFFPSDGRLSHEHCLSNNLYRKNPETGELMGGFFESNRRVVSIKLRGEYSEGFWQPISAFSQYNVDNLLIEGFTFTSLGGHNICEKYYTEETTKRMEGKKNEKKKHRENVCPAFHEHFDTKQLRYNIDKIPKDSLIYITAKQHGTSGRTGRHEFVEMPEFKKRITQRIKNCVRALFCLDKKRDFRYITGTRKTVVDTDKKDTGFYKDTEFRRVIHEYIKEIGLYKGETLYYEIVGYTDGGTPIMGSYHTEDKDIIKRYGNDIVFSYGCEKNSLGLGFLYKISIYRITMTNEDGVEIDYSWEQMSKRCNQLGLSTVPMLEKGFLKDKEYLLGKCRIYTDGQDPIDNRHPIEGVVIRIEDSGLFDFYKYKGNVFCDLEGIKKNSEYFVDEEEIS
jgi:hypothetical protein